MPDTLGDDMASTFYVVSVSGLTANPIYGQTAQIGKPLYASAHYFSKTAPTSVGWQWCDGAGEIAGATSAAYTPGPGDNLETLYPQAIPGGSYASRRGPAHTVRFAVPEVVGVLPDVSYVTGSGAQTVDASTGISGDDLTYSLSTSVPGVSIDSGTGIVTIQTGSDASGPVTITAANSGGAVRAGFDVSISATATAPAQMERPIITANGPTSLRIDLADATDDGGSPIISYDMRWREEGGSFESIAGASNPVFLTGLKADTTYQFKTRAVNAIGEGRWSKQASGTTNSVSTSDLPDLVPNADGTVDIKVNEGTFTVTIGGASNAYHNGTHGSFSASDLDTGPISIAAPVITGATAAGETLTAGPGVWVHETGDAPTIIGQWLRDGAPIAGETDTTYTTVAGDVGAVITYRETAANTAGSRSADSNGITVTAGAAAPAEMAAPSLSVDGASRITVTLAADPADGGSSITSYDLRYSTDETTWTDVISVTNPRAITDLTASTHYYVQARAVNGVGNGAWSASAPATTNAAPVGANVADVFTGYTLGETVYAQTEYDSPDGFSYCHVRDAGGTRVARQETTLQVHRRIAETFSNNREVSITCHEIPSSGAFVWSVLLSYADPDSYIMLSADAGGYYTLHEKWAGATTTHHEKNDLGGPPIQGDKLSISLFGSTLRAFKNNTQIGTDYTLAGQSTLFAPGFRLNRGSAVGNMSIRKFTAKDLF